MFDLRARKNGRPLLVGHRGAMAVAPENTMHSFEAALAGGADFTVVLPHPHPLEDHETFWSGFEGRIFSKRSEGLREGFLIQDFFQTYIFNLF